ncbi:MAG: tRNA uridine-5-carboxymethylaminomethyl(34) synthesis enzyme MnmG [candidate division Zixibacteria bacterium]|nr:tRNA uridine-5-carboxymethylaminomethyl(34) synthesis enzyme MnmG [candidate division Zixibacteria bacterium]
MIDRDFDIVVIGGGHAGVEAALVAARMGKTAAIVTMDPARLALMSCNPAIGGIGKSQLVAEIDALGGVMGLATDATGIQFRRLNLSRGPAVWSTRAQCDRRYYNQFVVDYVSAEPNVSVIEALAGDIMLDSAGRVCGVRTEDGRPILCRAVIVATGTFLGGLIHIGEKKIQAGRFGEQAAYRLSESFARLGFQLGRLKTGTPPRLDGDTIDWSRCEIQPGEVPMPRLSYRSEPRHFEQAPCYLTRTTDATREIMLASLTRSPMFSGQISSTGPRYCPSVEDKFFRFADKPTHNLFLEPEGNGTSEIYPNGFSTALPEDVQERAIRTVIGLEEVRITRPGYAVEYDYCPTWQIKPSLETRRIPGLFFAGQINGTSGYEEAAAQGLMAGINAVLMIAGEQPFVLDRSEAYIGVMIDDLCTRSITEPYRMFTSRAEYRLALRQDNARDRLFRYAARYSLVPAPDLARFRELEEKTQMEIGKLRATRVKTTDIPDFRDRFKKTDDVSLENLLRMPGIGLEEIMPVLARFDGTFSGEPEVLQRAAIRIRYEGYIAKQDREIEKFRKLERQRIPERFSYGSVSGLRIEARQKLSRFRPQSLGQAGRIEGVTPADVAILSVHLKRYQAESA